MKKQEVLFVAQTVVGAVIGLALRKKMVDKGMVKSFWKPGMIRKPGTYNK